MAKMMKKQKQKKEILEYYYMIPKEVTAKEITALIHSVEEEQIDVWPELNLLEVVLEHDSLIFQDGRECFEDPADLEFIASHGFSSIYVVSYADLDDHAAKTVIKEVMQEVGGLLCSDTDDFEPSYNVDTILL